MLLNSFSNSGSQPPENCFFHAMAQQAKHIRPTELNRVTYEDVFTMWKSLLGVYGIGELANMSNFQNENIRELLMKLAVVWADSPLHLEVVMETIQILTVFSCMTFKCQLDGEGVLECSSFRLSCWVEDSEVCPVPKPQASTPLRIKLSAFLTTPEMKELILREVGLALGQLESLCALAELTPQLLGRFQICFSLLDDAQTVARTIMPGQGNAPLT